MHPRPASSLTSGVQQAQPLLENQGRAFRCLKPAGHYAVPGETARQWLQLPNRTGVMNADVLRHFVGKEDLLEGDQDLWIVDFLNKSWQETRRYEQPLLYLQQQIEPERPYWWRFSQASPLLRSQLFLPRFLVLSHHLPSPVALWLAFGERPGDGLTVIRGGNDFTFGVLSSRIYAVWVSGLKLAQRSAPSPSLVFESFPFPHPAAQEYAQIEHAAQQLYATRTGLLGMEQRSGSVSLAKLYDNLGQVRLTARESSAGEVKLAHEQALLNTAVFEAYGWQEALTDVEVLTKLFALNHERTPAT